MVKRGVNIFGISIIDNINDNDKSILIKWKIDWLSMKIGGDDIIYIDNNI